MKFTFRTATPEEWAKGYRWVTVGHYWIEIDGMPRLSLFMTKAHRDGRPYATLYTTSGPTASLSILSCYAWDGSTGGTEHPEGIRASCVHDALYQIMRDNEHEWTDKFRRRYRWVADRAFLEIQAEDGMSWWRRRVRWLAVRMWPGNMRRKP